MKRKLAAISPLALLTVSACGGTNSGVAVSLKDFSGKAVKGPLQNAFVFLDLDGDGVYETGSGEKGDWTDATGGYDISGVDESKVGSTTVLRVFTKDVATAAGITGAGAGNTVDTLTNTDVAGIQLSAPDEATMVTPMTTLMAEGGVTEAQVKAALGLPDAFDVLNDNPADTLATEQVAHKVMNAISLLTSAGEGAGYSEASSFSAAVDAIASVVTSASAGGGTVNLSAAGVVGGFGLTDIIDGFEVNIAGEAGGDVNKVASVQATVSTLIEAKNGQVDQVSSLTDGNLAELLAGDIDYATQIESAVSSGDTNFNAIELTSGGVAVTNMLENLAADAVVGDLSAVGSAVVTAIELVQGNASSNFKVVAKAGGGFELQVAENAVLAVSADTDISLEFKVTTSDGAVSISQVALTVLDVSEFDGAVVKGPLEDALVFIDLNGDGDWDQGVDSEQVRTDATGAFSVDVYIPDGVTPEIVAVSDGTAKDASSGEYLVDGTTLSAPEGATVVTPMTTLVAEAGLAAADVAAALGLPDGVDPLTYNPYSSTVTAADALAVEKVSHQVMNTISSLKVAGEEAGLTANAALEKSMAAFKTVIVEAKAAQDAAIAADPNAVVTIKVNLNDSTDATAYGLGALVDDFSTKLGEAEVEDFEVTAGNVVTADTLAAAQTAAKAKVDFVKTSVLEGVATVNDLVESIPVGTTLSLENTREFFSVGTKLAEEVKSAVENGNANAITVDNPTVAKAVGSNVSATKIDLKIDSGVSAGDPVTSIAENPTAGDVVGLLSADDTGNLTYEVVGGGDASNFGILVDSEGVKLVVAQGAVIDAEATGGPTVSFKVKVSDSLGKSHVESFTLAVTNVEEAPSIQLTEVDVSQNATLSQDLSVFDPEGKDVTLALSEANALFDIQGGALVSSRAITQDDVDAGAQTLTIRMTDSGTGVDTTHSIKVNIKNVNDNPVFVTSSLGDGTEGASYSEALKATDADGDVVSFRLMEGPSWLSISGNTLSGTAPTDDTAIAEAATLKIAAEDVNGGQTVQNFSLNYVNVNDAPQFVFEQIAASVAETPDAIGVDAAQASDNVSGTLAVVDPDSDAASTVVSLTGGVERSDGAFAKIGTYGTLSYTPSTGGYLYTPNEEKIEQLHNESQTETFKFMVTDGELTDSLDLVVTISGANDTPRIADQGSQNFVDLGDGQTDTIIGDIKVLDGSQYAGFTLATASANNDNQYFDKDASGNLVLKSGVKSEDLTTGDLLVEVVAQDYDVNGAAVAGTTAAASSFLKVKKVDGDPAPTILDITTDYADVPLKVGDQLNFTVTLSESALAGGSSTLNLSNGSTVTVSVGSSNSQFLTGAYTVASGDTDATAASALEVAGFTSGSVVDLSTDGQGVISGNTFADLGDIVVDGNPPTAKITGDGVLSHTYATSTGQLLLQGEGLGTIVADASRDVTSVVDWTKLQWNVDALGVTTHTFSESDVLSAKVNDDGTLLTVTLSSAGQTTLHGLAGFGGTAATSGVADAINVAVGFVRDAAGNLSSENSTAASGVTMSDVTSPVLNEIDVSGAFTSLQGADRSRGDTFIVGDTLTYTAALSDANGLQDNADMNVNLTLSNDKVLTLTRADGATSADKTFSANYVIQDGDTDAASLTVKSYAVQNIVDISGNSATNAKSLELVTKTFSGMAADTGVAIDANAPTAKLLGTEANPHTYDVATGVLILQGESLGTVVVDTTTRDIAQTVDWSKLEWNVDGLDSTKMAFAASDVTTAIVDATGATLTVTLSSAGQVRLHALEGFGGTAASGGAEDSINVSAGLLMDGAGNLSSASSTAVSVAELLDNVAPAISTINVFGEFTSTQVSGRVAGDAFIAGDTLTYKATIAEVTNLQDSANMAVKLTLTNNKVLTLVRPDNATGADKDFSVAYIVTEGDTDDADLKVKSYTIENVSDLSGNVADNSKAVAQISMTFGGMAQDGTAIVVDANSPTAKILGTEALPHSYDAATGVLTLQGESLRTVLTSGDDVKEIVDWSELVWNVDGLGSATMAFAKSDVATAVVNSDGNQLTVTLSAAGKTSLHALDGFGGVEATSGVPDVINVGGGFMRDSAGNISSEVSTTASTASLTDEVAPVLSSIVLAPVVSSETLVGAGSTVNFKAEFTEAGSGLASDASMVLTLNNGASVTMAKSSVVGEELFLIGALPIVAGQNLDTLFDGGYVALDVSNIDVSDVRDDAGNVAASDGLLATVALGPVKVDTIAPTLQQALLNTTSNEMVFLFDEILSDTSIASLISGVDAVEDLAGSVASGTTNTKITATFSGSDVPTNGETMDFDISFEDLAGNNTTITEFEIGIIS